MDGFGWFIDLLNDLIDFDLIDREHQVTIQITWITSLYLYKTYTIFIVFYLI